jgi:serine/threonine-protein kinase RsbT
MLIRRREVLQLRSDSDVVRARQAVRRSCIELGFSLIDQTKMVTAASELARNTLTHGRGGTMTIETVEVETKRGVRLCFEDDGPGIPDIARALTDGFTSGTGLGLGLGGSKRLVHEFDIQSTPGSGTRVVAIRWR